MRQSNGSDLLLVCLYVDDLFVTENQHALIEEFKGRVKSEFEMNDLGTLHYFLGLEFAYASEGIILHQKKYVQEVL